MAVCVTIFGIRQEQYGHGDLLGRTGSAQGYVVEHPLDVRIERPIRAIEELARSLGQGRAGGDSIDQDAVGAELERHGLCEVDDARLGRHEGALEA